MDKIDLNGIVPCICPQCGAAFNKQTMKCDYCGTSFMDEGSNRDTVYYYADNEIVLAEHVGGLIDE